MIRRIPETIFSVIVLILMVTSCSKELLIAEPTYHRIADEIVRVEVPFKASDARFIRVEEIYLTLTTHECGSEENRYPAETFVGHSKVSDFDFPINGELVSFHSDIPVEVFDRYARPCMVLEGGSYFGRTISGKSTSIEPGEL